MILKDILDFDYEILQGSLDVDIKSITNNSNEVIANTLFVCITGFKVDGHSFIPMAISKGATAVLVEKPVEVPDDITVIKVEDTRKALALSACRFYDNPTHKMKMIGVTGTNGKTSTVFLIKYILEAFNQKTGIIGTIENRIGDIVLEASRTTPESIELQSLFSQMVEQNVDAAIMEVSSHALDLKRVEGCKIDIGIFTNLTLDHLDYHKTMENYRDAKLKLFEMCEIGVINMDDPVGKYMKENGSCKRYITFGCKDPSYDLYAYDIHNSINGTSFKLSIDLKEYVFELKTPGMFSVYNALGVIGATLALSVPIEIIQKTLKEKSFVRGRFQTLKSPKGYYAVVDYAHTPDGLLNVLDTIQEFAQRRVITVFGCGGDRDKSKRPKMGEFAGQKSDYVIITSDNPRTEDPAQIIDDVEKGIIPTGCGYSKVVDRGEAIKEALKMAEKDDVVLIAGKGHEDYQIIGSETIHFDDVEQVEAFYRENK